LGLAASCSHHVEGSGNVEISRYRRLRAPDLNQQLNEYVSPFQVIFTPASSIPVPDGWQAGGPASYCSAVAFPGDDVLVSASVDHFAAQGAIYRRPVDGHDALVAVGEGLPAWSDGIVDTGCIATRGSAVALADRKGNLYVSADTGRSWSRRASGLPPPSRVLIV
jgi:hypothetical protein